MRPIELGCVLACFAAFAQPVTVRIGHVYDSNPEIGLVAFQLAEREMRQSGLIGADVQFQFLQRKGCDIRSAPEAVYHLYDKDGIDVLFGPPCTAGMDPVGHFAYGWNLPVIGYSSPAAIFANKALFGTLARVSVTLAEVTTAAAHLLLHFGWRQVAVVGYGGASPYEPHFAEALQPALRANGIALTLDVRLANWDDPREIEQALERIRRSARIVLLHISVDIGRNSAFLRAAHEAGMMTAEYVYIIVWSQWDESHAFPWTSDGRVDSRMADICQHVFLMQPTGHQIVDDNVRMILETAGAEGTVEKADVLPFMRDTMQLYGIALNECLAMEPNCSYKNGAHMFDLFKNRRFTGSTGAVVMNSDGERLSDYILQTTGASEPPKLVTRFLLQVDESSPVGLSPNRTLIDIEAYEWRTEDGKPPPDEPICGFTGEKCPPDYTFLFAALAAVGTLSTILGVVIALNLRKRWFEQQLQAMGWRIAMDEITHMPVNAGSTIFTGSHARISKQPSMFGDEHNDTAIGIYEGQKVLIKEFRVILPVNLTNRKTLLELKAMKELQHDNLNAFLGSAYNDSLVKTVWYYCQKGELYSIIHNDEIQLDMHFKASILRDMVTGLEYLHRSRVGFHGRLTSANCLVDSRWTVKLSDYKVDILMWPHYQSGSIVRPTVPNYELAQLAPEILREDFVYWEGTDEGQASDIYGFGMVLYQVLFRQSPFEGDFTSGEELLNRLRAIEGEKPPCPTLPHTAAEFHPDLIGLLHSCWLPTAEQRPKLARVRNVIFNCTAAHAGSIVDHMLLMMERYASNLERMVDTRTREVIDERRRADELLEKMLPQTVATKLKQGLSVEPEIYESVTVFFSDVVEFTEICEASTPVQVVEMMNRLYSICDEIVDRFDAYKVGIPSTASNARVAARQVETVGDSYMVVSGLPERNGTRHVTEIAEIALIFRQELWALHIAHLEPRRVRVRVGVHSGSVAAGVVGSVMPHYCLFGDVVNMASRMESSGEPMKIQLSQATRELLEKVAPDVYSITRRGMITIKGRGVCETFWLDGRMSEIGKLEE